MKRIEFEEDRVGIVTCKECGSAGYRGESFCACCGTPFASPKHRCPNCRNIIAHSIANFCPHCGDDLKDLAP